MFGYAQHTLCRGVDAHGGKRLELIEQIAGKNVVLAALDDPFDGISDCLNMPLGLASQIILAAVANADFRPKMLGKFTSSRRVASEISILTLIERATRPRDGRGATVRSRRR